MIFSNGLFRLFTARDFSAHNIDTTLPHFQLRLVENSESFFKNIQLSAL